MLSALLGLFVACAVEEPVSPSAETQEQSSARPARGFTRTLELLGIQFTVACPNDSSLSHLEITPSGLEIDNSTVGQEVDGTVVGADVADLDGNGSPEIYVYVQSAGSGSYGTLAAYSANNRKSLSGIYLPPLSEGEEAARGYMGHDQFSVSSNRLIRRFPIYRDSDINARPTGGIRQLEYRLVPGEAGWLLQLDRSVDETANPEG